MTLRGRFTDFHARRRNRQAIETQGLSAAQANRDQQVRVDQSPAVDPPGIVRGILYQQCGGGRRIIRKKIGGV